MSDLIIKKIYPISWSSLLERCNYWLISGDDVVRIAWQLNAVDLDASQYFLLLVRQIETFHAIMIFGFSNFGAVILIRGLKPSKPKEGYYNKYPKCRARKWQLCLISSKMGLSLVLKERWKRRDGQCFQNSNQLFGGRGFPEYGCNYTVPWSVMLTDCVNCLYAQLIRLEVGFVLCPLRWPVGIRVWGGSQVNSR